MTIKLTLRERIDAFVLRTVLALPRPLLRRIAGPPVRLDGQELELETQALIKLMELNPLPPLETLSAAQGREEITRATAALAGRPVELAEVRPVTLAGRESALPARLYVPRDLPAPAPLLVFFHGGGFVVGDLDSHDPPCRFLAARAGVRVLAVDYRLAPEHPYPAPLDDCFAAFLDAAGRADELGADPARIAVGGDSAGGNLAAGVSLRAVAEGGAVPAFQLLIYPVTDASDAQTESNRLFAEGFPFLTAADRVWYDDHHLPDRSVRSEPGASPLFAEDLAGLPPAHVVTAGFDPLRDEGEAYARRLSEAGVPVSLHRHRGHTHGFINLVGVSRAAREAVLLIAGALTAGLGQAGSVREGHAAGS